MANSCASGESVHQPQILKNIYRRVRKDLPDHRLQPGRIYLGSPREILLDQIHTRQESRSRLSQTVKHERPSGKSQIAFNMGD